MSIFDDALEKRFSEAPLITAIEVTSNDTLLIRDLETGQIMRIPVSILYSALGSAFASLVDGKVPASQLPSYVDDVLEYANLAAFPPTGESGKIYVAIDTNLTYRWSGSGYVGISPSLALGETSSTAYRGDRGKTAYDHSQTTGNPHGTTKSDLGLSNVDNTSDANKPISTAQATAINAKEPTISAGTTAQYWRGDKSWQTLNKSAVGLGSVDNTADADKPVSTAQAAALAPKASPVFSGNIGLNTTPKPTAGDWKSFEMTYGSCLVSGYGEVDLVNQVYAGGVGSYKYFANSTKACRYFQSGGVHVFQVANGGTIDTTVPWIQTHEASASGFVVNVPIGFNSATPLAKPTISGSRSGNAALASLLTQLANYGLITDATTA